MDDCYSSISRLRQPTSSTSNSISQPPDGAGEKTHSRFGLCPGTLSLRNAHVISRLSDLIPAPTKRCALPRRSPKYGDSIVSSQIALKAFLSAISAVSFYSTCQGDIINWQSGAAIPGTEGLTLGPGIDLSGRNTQERNLRFADFQDGDLSSASFQASWLDNARFVRANLSNADFRSASLPETDLTDAIVLGTNFQGTELSAEQLYSTTSYQMRDLTGLGMDGSNMTGWSFAGQKLTGVDFEDATLVAADLSDADITGAGLGGTGISSEQLYSTASYKMESLAGVRLSTNDLTGWNFVSQSLENAHFARSVLTNADLSDAVVVGASFRDTALTAEQLYSTASYRTANLTGIDLAENSLNGWNLSQQNLTDANFDDSGLTNTDFTDAIVAGANFHETKPSAEQLYSTASYKTRKLTGIGFEDHDLSGWSFVGQNLAGADFDGAELTGADLSLADLRGAIFRDIGQATADATLRNTILPDGSVRHLELLEDDILTIRDDELPLSVEESMTLAATSTLELVLKDTSWGSTVTLANSIVPDIGGTLALRFDDETDVGALVGTTFELFDWNGQLSIGDRFDRIVVEPGHVWNIDQLYTNGSVQLAAIPEPSSFMLVTLSFASWGWLARRGRK